VNQSVASQIDSRRHPRRQRTGRPRSGPVLLALLALLVAVLGAACSSSGHHPAAAKASTSTTRPNTVLVAMGADPELATFLTALRLGTPAGTLAGAGPYTVLAPTNHAFAALAPSTIAPVDPAGKQKLVKIIDGHILAGGAAGQPLSVGKATTASGATITVARSGDNLIVTDAQGHSAKVTKTLRSGNGLVYVVDGVLLPS